MEEKIYERQVTKETLSQRVVDEQQVDRHFTQNDLQALYQFTPDKLEDKKERPTPVIPKVKNKILSSLTFVDLWQLTYTSSWPTDHY